MAVKKIAILGLGHIGSIVELELRKYEKHGTGLIDPTNTLEVFGYDLSNGVDFSDPKTIPVLLDGMDAVIATTPYMFNHQIAKTAAEQNVAYFDVTEDVETTKLIEEMDSEAPMVPQCGLAPGMVSILANTMADTFDEVDKIEIRVGALPQSPNNHMRYNFTWSTIGLINEYCNECHELENSTLITRPPLSNPEKIILNGMDLEAATTSGGIGTLAESWCGTAKTVNYKTIRYPGHFDYMRFLRDDLKMADNKELFKTLFDNAVPRISNDLILIAIYVTGKKDNKLVQESYDRLIMPKNNLTAIQLATVSGLLAVVDVWLAGGINLGGFTTQESLNYDQIVKSIYSKVYLA